MKDETFFEYPVFDNIKQVIYHSVEKYPNNAAFRLKEKRRRRNKIYRYNIYKIFRRSK